MGRSEEYGQNASTIISLLGREWRRLKLDMRSRAASLIDGISQWALRIPADPQAFQMAVKAIILPASLAATAVFWVAPLRSSFWLDETGTVWAIHGSFAETVIRAYDRPGQPSVLFSILAWLTVAIGGLHELTLRFPSIVACLIAAVGVYRLGLRFMDRGLAVFASVIFALNGMVIFAASDARPYSLAVMAVVWAIVMLIRWCDTGRLASGVWYALLTALSIALHYLSATTVIIHLAYIASRPRLPNHFSKVAAILCISVTPLIRHAAHLWHLRAEHSFATTPSVTDLAGAVVPLRVLVGLCVGVLLARIRTNRLVLRQPSQFRREQIFFAAWHVIPIVLLWLISLLSDAKLFFPRYYLWSVPGLALFVATLVGGIRSARAQTAVEFCVVAALCCRPINWGPSAHGGENWRGALNAAKKVLQGDSVLMLRTAFVEPHTGGGDLDSTIEDPTLAPLAMYPVDCNVVSAPIGLGFGETQRLEKIVSGVVQRHTTLVFVSRRYGPPVDTWLLGRFSGTGYRVTRLGEFDGLIGIVFTAADAAAGTEPTSRASNR